MSAAVRIVIAEDEAVIARRLARLTTDILGPRLASLTITQSVSDTRVALAAERVDILLLDLQLEGEEGFELLRDFVAAPFDTIVVSAHVDRALEAFEYGVRDFVPKPFGRARLETALLRTLAPPRRNEHPVTFLGVRRGAVTEMIPIDDVAYVRGAGTHSELVLASGGRRMHDKMLDRLEALLPPQFERIHRSYIVDIRRIARLVAQEGSRYFVELRDGTTLPVGRTRVGALRERVG
jgi:DNA-binding LytR/AlgR family response regulator